MGENNNTIESERRIATVMFADISGFTAMSEKIDHEQVTGVMNECFCRMEECVNAYGGTIDKFIGDCVMVLFGLPKALEASPQKAVNTAIEIRNSLAKFNKEKQLVIPLSVHIGINTGPVLAGMVGGIEKQEYTVMGDAVNLAARLEDASKTGQILVGPDTYHATKDVFDYKILAPISFKGKAEPVPVYEVLSIKEQILRGQRDAGHNISSVMVGRDDQMLALEFHVMKALTGQGSIISIIGEPGIGKSRLMAELKNRDVMQRVTILEGRAISIGRALSFHLVIDLLKNWAGITEDHDNLESLNRLEPAVRAIHPEAADEIVPFVATLMGIRLIGRHAERVRGIEGEALEKLILKNVRDLLIKGSQRRPLVIILEDLHWADTSSIELIESLFNLAEKQLVVFLNVFRPDYTETSERVRSHAMENHSTCYHEVYLDPLDEKHGAELITNLLQSTGIPYAIKEQIIQRSGGNPYFIEEVVQSLIEQGAVVLKDGGYKVTDTINTIVIPHTINDVLMSRIDRLEKETRELVRMASVIGRSFFYRVISEVAKATQQIDARLKYLEDIQLIREHMRMEELEYLFKHALAQEAVYESILIQRRKELHLQVANAIEKIFHDKLHDFYGMLAYHYGNGEDLDKTEEYLIPALLPGGIEALSQTIW